MAACASCGAALAPDQRYCLECGERRPTPSDFLLAGPPAAQSSPTQPPAMPPTVPATGGQGAKGSQWLPIIAGVGVLLLAMGVGVLIGRAGGSNSTAPPAQVITIGGVGGTSTAAAGSGEEQFTADWPAGTKGFTVQLQTLPEGTTVAAVGQAKTEATTKGASAVGALKESSYSSLTGSGYLIYSGDYHSKSEATKALGKLKSKFPAAKVVEVANSSSSSSSGASESGSSGSGANLGHPAPATVLKRTSKARGKNYEEQSKSLPNVVETG